MYQGAPKNNQITPYEVAVVSQSQMHDDTLPCIHVYGESSRCQSYHSVIHSVVNLLGTPRYNYSSLITTTINTIFLKVSILALKRY